MPHQELFGDPGHKALLERGEALWRVVRDHPRYAYYGTVVSLSDPGKDTADVVASLARIQGLGMCFYLPKTEAASIRHQLDGQGFRTAQSLFCSGGEASYQASRSLLDNGTPPEGVTIELLSERSPDTLIEATLALCQACGLSAMPGEIMRGSVLPGINLVARDAAGAPVATAASYAMHAPEHRVPRRHSGAFWPRAKTIAGAVLQDGSAPARSSICGSMKACGVSILGSKKTTPRPSQPAPSWAFADQTLSLSSALMMQPSRRDHATGVRSIPPTGHHSYDHNCKARLKAPRNRTGSRALSPMAGLALGQLPG